MKILKLIVFLLIVLTAVFAVENTMIPLKETHNYPSNDVSLSKAETDTDNADISSDTTDGGEEFLSDFEARYDLTDKNLSPNDLSFNGVKRIETVEQWKEYMDICIKRGYRFVFFEAPKELVFEPDTLMSANDITSAIIYTMPDFNDDTVLTGYGFTYTYSHDILEAVRDGNENSLDEKQRSALECARGFLATLPRDISDYEKELAIHNYVCGSITYTRDSSMEDIINCYGGLVLGRGNCQAYTDAFNLLCGLSGFESGRLTCTANGEEHSLNYIVINNVHYFTDCTFDDGIDDKDRGYGLFYFNVPYSVISINHTFDKLPFTPAEELDSNSYYMHYELFADSPYALEQVFSRLSESSSSGEILFDTSQGDASLAEIFQRRSYMGKSKISVSKYTFGKYQLLKFSLS